MKKIILYSFLTICLLFNITKAQEEIDYSQIVNTTTMPTQEEIMEILNKFNFNEAQKQQLLKETTKRLEDLYHNNDYSVLMQGQEAIKQQNIQELEELIPSEQNSKRVKKYSNHDPLSKHDPLTRKRDRKK